MDESVNVQTRHTFMELEKPGKFASASAAMRRSIRIKNFKPIFDEIDTVLAAHYGFTAEELDFILNYDIKYRLGRSGESDED